MIDNSVIERCKQKDRKAFKECYEACAPYVFAIVKNYITGHDDRKDAMQEVFAHIFHSMKSYDPAKGKFKSWIAQVTVNRCIDLLQKKKRLNFLVPLNEGFDAPVEQDESPIDIQSDLFQSLSQRMPTGYKTVFLLSYMEGYSHDEISQILNITAQTSRSQLTRAIKWIRANCQEQTKNIYYG